MKNILLILEGNEEQTLYNIAKKDGFSKKFIVDAINANGSGNIPLLFQDYLSNPFYDLILCVYDVDNRAEDQDSPFSKTRKGLKNVLQKDEKVDGVSFCTNPNIIQFFLLGADKLENVKLTSTSKAVNSKILHKYWNEIGRNQDKKYDAREWQLKIIVDSYVYDSTYPYSYSTLLENAKQLPLDYKKKLPGSNLPLLLDALKTGDENYIQDLINKQKIDKGDY